MTYFAVYVQLMAEEAMLEVDVAGFNRCMEHQKEQGRKARKSGAGGKLKFEAEATAHLSKSGVATTIDKPK
jgi:alanyl-tRNA synthetase